MKVQDHPELHLTYCLNIHPGESWAENLAAIKDQAAAIARRVAGDQAFGLGLRLGAQAARSLTRPEKLKAFARILQDRNLYVFTINGFPYGGFHDAPVKQNVYAPDWRTQERRDYTIDLCNILAELLPPGLTGSISTVPGSYKAWIRDESDVRAMACNLAQVALHLSGLLQLTGKLIVLSLEGEPDCFIQTTQEAIDFLTGPLLDLGAAHLQQTSRLPADVAREVIRRHVGLCLDTAHAAMQFEDPARSLQAIRQAGVALGKVQISSALEAVATDAALRRLEEFADAVYLHQVRARLEDGRVLAFDDLPAALACPAARNPHALWRIHYHVPMFFAGDGTLGSTGAGLCGPFAALLRQGATAHLEIETYTFSVLPDSMGLRDVVDCVSREFDWVRTHLLGRQGGGAAGEGP